MIRCSRLLIFCFVAVDEEGTKDRCVVRYLCSFNPSRYGFPSPLLAKLFLFSFVVHRQFVL